MQGTEAAPAIQAPVGGAGPLPTSTPAMQEMVAATPSETMAQTAAVVAIAPPMGALRPPGLIETILCDHSSTLTLFNTFFSAAAAANAAVMDMAAAALALDLRLHSQAESVALYPLLQSRLGQGGAQWAARALAEHALIEQAVADVLTLRPVGGEALANRLKQLQADFVAHQAEEEGAILPAVASVISAEESLALAEQFKAAKQAAPIAPQPALAQAQAAQASLVAALPPVAAATPAMGGAGPSTITTGDTAMGGTAGGAGRSGGEGAEAGQAAAAAPSLGGGAGAGAMDMSGLDGEASPAGAEVDMAAGAGGMAAAAGAELAGKPGDVRHQEGALLPEA